MDGHRSEKKAKRLCALSVRSIKNVLSKKVTCQHRIIQAQVPDILQPGVLGRCVILGQCQTVSQWWCNRKKGLACCLFFGGCLMLEMSNYSLCSSLCIILTSSFEASPEPHTSIPRCTAGRDFMRATHLNRLGYRFSFRSRNSLAP